MLLRFDRHSRAACPKEAAAAQATAELAASSIHIVSSQVPERTAVLGAARKEVYVSKNDCG